MTSNFIIGDYPILYSSFSNFISDKFSIFFSKISSSCSNLLLPKLFITILICKNMKNTFSIFFRMDRNGCTAPLAVLLACSGQFSSEYHPLFRYPENCDSQNHFSQNSRLPSCNNEFPPPLQRTLRKFSKNKK